jgi:hypothetical protein
MAKTASCLVTSDTWKEQSAERMAHSDQISLIGLIGFISLICLNQLNQLD